MDGKQSTLPTADVIGLLESIVELINPFLIGHQRRVADLSRAIAVELKLPGEVVEGIRLAGLVHDIGEIGIPIQILSKPGRLSAQEYELIKGHPQIGYQVLKPVAFSQPVAEYVLQHHERLDGSGYPHRAKGDAILLPARILGAADVVEAIASHRPYRTAPGLDPALEEIAKNKGTLFDPSVVESCVRLFREKRFVFQ